MAYLPGSIFIRIFKAYFCRIEPGIERPYLPEGFGGLPGFSLFFMAQAKIMQGRKAPASG